MITVNASPALTIDGMSRHECEQLAGFDPIRQADIASIRRFVEANGDVFRGRVLDFGAGKPGTCRKPQPHREVIKRDGVVEYVPYDIGDEIPVPLFDVVLCTQVLQYIEDPALLMEWFRRWLNAGGALVMTYPTNWAEVEQSDLWRFTKAGMDRMLDLAGFDVQVHERRAEVRLGGFTFPIGYGVVAVAR